ncbi:MAG: HNH endonuclease signature motif containing protein [Pirellulales bacterium]
MYCNWTHEERSAVWFKGRAVPGVDGDKWRLDVCGAWIGWQFYGNRNSQYGWEVDHIDPRGGDGLHNLQPLQWENNVAKGDGHLACVVTASGVENVAVR